jgi:alpha/beta superfamily hydrolase
METSGRTRRINRASKVLSYRNARIAAMKNRYTGYSFGSVIALVRNIS